MKMYKVRHLSYQSIESQIQKHGINLQYLGKTRQGEQRDFLPRV